MSVYVRYLIQQWLRAIFSINIAFEYDWILLTGAEHVVVYNAASQVDLLEIEFLLNAGCLKPLLITLLVLVLIMRQTMVPIAHGPPRPSLSLGL